MTKKKIEFPEKLDFLFQPKRYKVLFGGRGSGKSWGVARALLALAASKPLRVLCTREVQKSIKDSVHRLLKDQLESMGLGGFFEVTQNEIRGANGSLFLFAGLSDQTAESIKSFEGVDIAWIEEARNVSKQSWQILVPTIRKEGSEIWVTFNPELDDDETFKRFVLDPSSDCISVAMNWRDNPWWGEILDKERLEDKRKLSSTEYEWIWEGKTKPAVEGAIYAREIASAQEQKRICNVPYDPLLKVHVITDLGWNDSSVWLCVQKVRSEIRVIDMIEDSQQTLDHYSAELRKKNYNWGTMFLPHDAKAKTLSSGGRSTEQIMRGFGWSVQIVGDIGVEEGIKQARMLLPRTYFDKERAAPLLGHLRRYRRSMPKTGEPGGPVHDEHSHAADAYRYVAVAEPKMQNASSGGGKIKYSNGGVI